MLSMTDPQSLGPDEKLPLTAPQGPLEHAGEELQSVLPFPDVAPLEPIDEALFASHALADPVSRVRLRWMLASVFVTALHVGTAYAILNWPQPPVPSGEPPAAFMIELAPLPVAPETVEKPVPVGPEAEMSEESTPSEKKVEEQETEKSETPVEPKVAEAEPTPEPVAEDTPKLPEVPDADAVLPAPVEKPAQPNPTEDKPVEPPKEEQKDTSRPRPQSTKAAQTTTAPKPLVAPRAKTNAAPSAGVATSASMSSWRGMVVAHINRHKRYPGGGSRGTSSVAFTIDRSGRVLSARLIRSSGSSALDQEAVSLARRASPVPAPPSNITGRSIVLTVPIRFSR